MDNLHGMNWQFEKIKTVEVSGVGFDLNAAVVRRFEADLKGTKLSLLFRVHLW